MVHPLFWWVRWVGCRRLALGSCLAGAYPFTHSTVDCRQTPGGQDVDSTASRERAGWQGMAWQLMVDGGGGRGQGGGTADGGQGTRQG
ncbi:hypothetical protein LX32DRAFT_430005 [Colletotrichum zoysiae]|uniref:Secreted protein n=1 Tax=Colletotrichum zoysiae TaxID=1216348 RepID=A0AAD9HGK4_9PEZI|nr:hypothetical protein LX32DRAFT_430005 [Colletotrichum zoysiae]